MVADDVIIQFVGGMRDGITEKRDDLRGIPFPPHGAVIPLRVPAGPWDDDPNVLECFMRETYDIRFHRVMDRAETIGIARHVP